MTMYGTVHGKGNVNRKPAIFSSLNGNAATKGDALTVSV